MEPYAKTHRSGAWVTMAKAGTLYEVKLYSSGGGLIDKVRCDDYRMALEYRLAFNKQAQAMP